MYAARALVIASDVTCVDGRLVVVTPDNAFDDPQEFLRRLAKKARQVRCEEMTVILEASAAAALGFPKKAPLKAKVMQGHPTLVEFRKTGYMVSELKPWFTLWAHGRPTIHIGIAPWLGEQNNQLHHVDGGNLSWRLAQFQNFTGVAFHGSSALAASTLLMQLGDAMKDPQGRPLKIAWKPTWEGCTPAKSDCEQPYMWGGDHLAEGLPYRWKWDASRQYLAAAHNSPVPIGELRRTRRRAFTRKAQGYWRIVSPVWNIPELPNPTGKASGVECWVTTPTMELLEELAAYEEGYVVMPEVLDSWTTDEGIRDFFRPWVSRVETAYRCSIDDTSPDGLAVTDAIKGIYKRGIGFMKTSTGRLWRPDWRHTIIAKARANLFRKIFGVWRLTGAAPIHINYDEVTYESRYPDLERAEVRRFVPKSGKIEAAFPLKDGLGGFGVKRFENVNGKWKETKSAVSNAA